MKRMRVRDERREFVFGRDDFRCVWCGFFEAPESALAKGVTKNMGRDNHLTIDHIVPRSRGGTSDVDNLRTLCADCHRAYNRGVDRGLIRVAA